MAFTDLVGIRAPTISHALGGSGSGNESRRKKRERKRNPLLLLSLLGSIKGVRNELKRSRAEDERNHSERDVLEGQDER